MVFLNFKCAEMTAIAMQTNPNSNRKVEEFSSTPINRFEPIVISNKIVEEIKKITGRSNRLDSVLSLDLLSAHGCGVRSCLLPFPNYLLSYI